MPVQTRIAWTSLGKQIALLSSWADEGESFPHLHAVAVKRLTPNTPKTSKNETMRGNAPLRAYIRLSYLQLGPWPTKQTGSSRYDPVAEQGSQTVNVCPTIHVIGHTMGQGRPTAATPPSAPARLNSAE